MNDLTINALFKWREQQLIQYKAKYIGSIDEDTGSCKLTREGHWLRRDVFSLAEALENCDKESVEREAYNFQSTYGIGLGYFISEGKKELGGGIRAHIAKTKYRH